MYIFLRFVGFIFLVVTFAYTIAVATYDSRHDEYTQTWKVEQVHGCVDSGNVAKCMVTLTNPDRDNIDAVMVNFTVVEGDFISRLCDNESCNTSFSLEGDTNESR